MTKFSVSGMTCAACSAHVEKAVAAVPGVESVSVSLLTNSMNVDFVSPASAEAIVIGTGQRRRRKTATRSASPVRIPAVSRSG